ncbi:hypothetical protein P167DRAFT_577808 [Morchella conica CCBAS932]|uniref:Uncharacterized protein n=1 Tax=Morchella conica CCBAS932 TaxID=1392247 RepID=A0A3N4KEL1_9PEZI|nr:hypothetical protein P167DRAFT_577808 [Morchella conica CCBAS932]
MSKARISRVNEDDGEAYPVDLSSHTGYVGPYSSGPYQDPSSLSPYSPYQTEYTRSGGYDVVSPDIPQSQSWRSGGAQTPEFTFTRTATSGPLGYSPIAPSGPRLSQLISASLPATLNPGMPAAYSNRNSTTTAEGGIEIEEIDQSYDGFKARRVLAVEHDNTRSNRGSTLTVPGGTGGLGREKSIVRRISTRIMSTVRGRPKSGWSYQAGNGGDIDEEARLAETTADGYSKVEGGEDAINYDLDFFSADHVPAAAVQAYQEHNMNPDFAYTGNGEAIDLSSFSGLDADKDSDNFSLHRAGNLESRAQTAYYFPPNRDIPNWKPFPMRTGFLLFLLFLSLLLLVGAEVLFQFSDRGLLRADKKPGILSFFMVDDLDIVQFAMWKYMPTVVGVIYGILWKITDTEVKRAEPYYQLSYGARGAMAASTLNIEYQTFWSLLVPIAALKHRQWVVVASSVASLVAFAIVPMFLSVFVKISPSQKSRQQSGKPDREIEKTIVVDIVFTRILETTLVIIIVLNAYMTAALKKRRSGLLGDPSGIAGVAAMANKSHILMDFQGLDSASEEKIHKQLNKRTYLLHKGSLWQADFLKESDRDNQAPKAMNAHPLLLRLKGGVPFLIFLVVLAGLLPPMAHPTPLNVVIDKTPWVLTALSVTIKSLWEIVEKDMRMLEPFWILYNRHAPSSILTLDYSATVPGWLVVKALFKGHYLLAWVGFVSVLIEILTVAMGSLDYNGGEESGLSFRISFAFSMGILFILIATMALVLHLRRHPFLPRQPGTISSVLAFIHQSKMLVDFEGTEEASTAERREKLKKLGMTYAFGWFQGRDGKRHLGIDHEEIIAIYKFGDDAHIGGRIEEVTGWDRLDST